MNGCDVHVDDIIMTQYETLTEEEVNELFKRAKKTESLIRHTSTITKEDYYKHIFSHRAVIMWTCNFVCFLAHAAMGTAVVWKTCEDETTGEGSGHLPEFSYDFPLTTLVSTWRKHGMYDVGLSVPAVRKLSLAGLCVAFAFITAGVHVMVCFVSAYEWYSYKGNPDSVKDLYYYDAVLNRVLWWRWAEYSITAPIMLLAMQLTSGIVEVNILALSSFGQSAVMFCGWLAERASSPRRVEEVEDALKSSMKQRYHPIRRSISIDWSTSTKEEALQFIKRTNVISTSRDNKTQISDVSIPYAWLPPFLVGAYVHVAVWTVFILQFLRNCDSTARSRDRDVPGFVYAIVGGEVALFSIFVIPLVVFQTSYASYKTYWWSEVVYCTLSLTSKVFLNGMMLAYVFI